MSPDLRTQPGVCFSTRLRTKMAMNSVPADPAGLVSMSSILVIDDDPGIRELVRLILETREEADHPVLEAADGKEGLQLFWEHSPDVVIVDLFMPGIEGMETIKEISGKSPKTKIIGMSGGAHYLLDIAKALGAHEVLRKPFRSEDLLNRLERTLAAA